MEFINVCNAVMAVDNSVRLKAEQHLADLLVTNPDSVVLGFAGILEQHEVHCDNAQVAAILLRQYVTRLDVWNRLSGDVKRCLRESVEGVVCNSNVSKIVYRKATDLFSTLLLAEENENQKSVIASPALQKLLSSADPLHREAGLQVLDSLSEFKPEQVLPILPQIKNVLIDSFKFSNSFDVQIRAVKTSVSVLLVLEKAHFPIMLEVLPLIFKTLMECNDEFAMRDMVASLIHLASGCPIFFKPYIRDVVNAMIQLSASHTYEITTRRISFEFLCVLAENAKAMSRKCDLFVRGVFPLAFEFLAQLDLELDFEVHDNDEEQEVFLIGVSSIARLSTSLGCKIVKPVVQQLLANNLGHQDWLRRHASLVLIETILESEPKIFSGDTRLLMSKVLEALGDNQPHIRHEAILCLIQFFAGDDSDVKDLSNLVLHKVLAALLNDSHSRIRLVGTEFIAHFFQLVELKDVEECLLPTLEYLKGALELGVRESNIRYLEAIISAITSVAALSEAQFSPFYNSFVPNIFFILSHCVIPERSTLKGKCLECLSFIGSSVGREIFAGDAKRVLDDLIGSGDNIGLDLYTQGALARIGQVLGDWFVPYLEFIVPRLVLNAQTEGGFTISEASAFQHVGEENNNAADIETFNFSIRGVGDRKVSINAALLEQKATAVQMLYQYSSDFGSEFSKYVIPVAQAVVPLATYPFSEDVRVAAVATAPALIRCVQGCDSSLQMQLFDFIYNNLVAAMRKEPIAQSLSDIVGSFGECLSESDISLSIEKMRDLCLLFVQLMNESDIRRETQYAHTRDEQDVFETDELDQHLKVEIEILGGIVDCVQTMIRTAGSSFLPTFQETISSRFELLLAPSRTSDEQASALCIFDEILEYGGELACSFVDKYCPVLLQFSSSKNVDVVQSAVYGLGVCAQVNNISFLPFCSNAINILSSIINSSSPSTMRDTAISAFGKILLGCHEHIAVEEMTLFWMNLLPLKEDEEEAIWPIRTICSMLEIPKFQSIILTHDPSIRTTLRNILNQVFHLEISDESLTNKVNYFLSQIN